MAGIQKRVSANGTTTYVVRWYAPDGTERTKGGFRTKKAAEDYAAIHVEPKRRRGIDVNPNAGKVLFREAAEKWLAGRHDLKETTRAAYADALAPTSEHTVKRHKRLADLRIDNTFGDYPINAIKRDDISDWVARMLKAGKRPSTIRNAYFLVRQVLGQAVADGRLDANPADYVKLPTDHNTGHVRAVDDPAQFLTPAQVATLVAATPWPFSVMVHLAAWSGLRAAELAGLRVGDVVVPRAALNPNAATKPGTVRVEQTIAWTGAKPTAIPPKTKGSRRTVPLTPATTALLRDYLAVHPRRDEPTAPLFPGVRLQPPRPTGVADPLTLNQRLGQPRDGSAAGGGARGPLDCRGGGAAGARLGRPEPARHLLQGRIPPGGVARQQAYPDRRATAATQIPWATTHLRELVHRGGTATAGGRAVHGPRQGHHDARCLRAPVRRRLRRRDGRARINGGRAELRPERGAAPGLSQVDVD
jgi:integrase